MSKTKAPRLKKNSQAAEVYPFYVCVQWEWGWGAPQRIFQAKHAWFLLMSL